MALATFPALVGVEWPLIRNGPIFDTVVQQAISGKQTAYPKRVTPTWTWELSFDVLRSSSIGLAEMQTLAGFIASCYGRATPFAYQDAEDNAVVAQPFGAGDGASVAFRLVRSFGGFVEPVYVPTGVPQIFVAGTLLNPATDYAIGSSGIVTFTIAPAAGAILSWTGIFSWLCRFDADTTAFSAFARGFWELKKLSFSSVIG